MVQIPIEFLAQFDKSQKELAKFASQTDKSVSGIEKRFSTLTTVVGAVFGAAIIKKGFDATISGLKSVITEGAKYETEVTRLGQSLRITNEFSQQAVNRFIALGDEIERTTIFTGGQIAEQVALAKTYSLTNKETESLVKASVALAGATGKDLNTATTLLANSYSGQAGQLRKLVPEVANLTEEQLLSGAAIDIIAKKFANFAGAELNTFNGQIIRSAQNLENIQEAAGRAITEDGGIRQILKEYNAALVSFTELINENRAEIGEFISVVLNGFFTIGKVTSEVFRVFELGFRTIGLAGQAIIDTFKTAASAGEIVIKLLKGDFAGAAKIMANNFKETAAAANSIGDASTRYDKFGAAVDRVQERVADASAETKALQKSTNDLGKEFDSSADASKRFGQKLKGEFETLQKQIEETGAIPLETLSKKLESQIRLVNKALSLGVTNEKTAVDIIGKLRLKYEYEVGEERKRLADEEKKRYEELAAKLREITQNPLKVLVGNNDRGNRAGLSENQQRGVAAGGGALTTILGGAEGAKKLIGNVGTALGFAIAGPAGEVLGPILEQLSAGPEQVKAQIRAFAQAIPDLIQAIIESIPVVIEELANQAPLIIERLTDKAPEIIEALIEKAPSVMVALAKSAPKVTFALVSAMPKVIAKLLEGVPRFIERLVSGAGQFVARILEGAVMFVAKILEGAANFIGAIINGAGRFIEELVKGIGKALSGLGGGGIGGIIGGGSGGLGGLLTGGFAGSILGGGGGLGGAIRGIGRSFGFKTGEFGGVGAQAQVPTKVVLQIERRQLAEVMVDLNRLGYRTI